MNIWILIIFTFNVNYAYSATYEFHSEKACRNALAVIQKTIEYRQDTPVAQSMAADCVEDIKN